jgi:hypothetical protein
MWLVLTACGAERQARPPVPKGPPEWDQMLSMSGCEPKDTRFATIVAFINQEYVWSMCVLDGNVATIVEHFNLEPIDDAATEERFHSRFPVDWRPSPSERNVYFGSNGFPLERTLPGGRYLMMLHDPVARRLYVWCKLNFG